jgi:hypothetical protein
MSGALVELVAKGVQDAYLTGNPEVSFFRQQYKRHTNFAQKQVQLTYTGAAVATNQISVKIPNKGDMLGYMWMDLNPFSNATVGTSNVSTLVGNGSNQPTFFELYIGGQLVDRQDAIFMVQFWQKFLNDSSAKGYSLLGTSQDSSTTPMQNILASQWLPLHFFFCDMCYLPLVALQYHEVEVRITFGSDYSKGNSASPNFYANYIVLDTAERTSLVDKEVDILIEQVQRITAVNNSKFDLSFLNHPVKCLLWGDSNVGATNATAFLTQQVQIYLNGTEVFGSAMPDIFFSSVSSYYHCEHSSILQGGQNQLDKQQSGGNLKMYSFALKANKHQPCGTCNFSRLDTASLTFVPTTPQDTPTNFYMYAVNFNVLRIKSGMAGIAFSS